MTPKIIKTKSNRNIGDIWLRVWEIGLIKNVHELRNGVKKRRKR